MARQEGPLAGIRVLALESYIAGPFGSMIMGDLGAEVIKVEPPSGDPARHFAGPGHRGEVFYYLAFNRNKKSVVLDLTVDSNRQAFWDLVRISDIVWDNFRPGVIKRLGASFYRLRRINPSIICCSITGYGETGPKRDLPCFDIVGQALSGMMSVTGEPGRPPVRCGPPIGDLAAGMFGVIGVLAALAERQRTGKGQQVNVSLLDSCVSLMSYYFSYYFCSGVTPRPQGSGHLGTAPYGAYKTRDGRWIVTGVNWPRIAQVLGAEWAINDARFQSQQKRAEHKHDLDSILQECFLEADAQQWLDLLDAEGIAVGLVKDVAEAANDEQIISNKMIISLKHALGGKVKLTGNPIKIHRVKQAKYSAPPLLGQHTEEVLKGLLGYPPDKVRKIKEDAQAVAIR
ncbi:MAG: CoA transferase [Chloroflexi bacterium]|nr:MAG: CoA transferase [Chloroflexota bacterium]